MSRPIQVMKFGGTSVGDATRIRSAATIAAEASKQRSIVVVVSRDVGGDEYPDRRRGKIRNRR